MNGVEDVDESASHRRPSTDQRPVSYWLKEEKTKEKTHDEMMMEIKKAKRKKAAQLRQKEAEERYREKVRKEKEKKAREKEVKELAFQKRVEGVLKDHRERGRVGVCKREPGEQREGKAFTPLGELTFALRGPRIAFLRIYSGAPLERTR